jgi:hypothetical protein
MAVFSRQKTIHESKAKTADLAGASISRAQAFKISSIAGVLQ